MEVFEPLPFFNQSGCCIHRGILFASCSVLRWIANHCGAVCGLLGCTSCCHFRDCGVTSPPSPPPVCAVCVMLVFISRVGHVLNILGSHVRSSV